MCGSFDLIFGLHLLLYCFFFIYCCDRQEKELMKSLETPEEKRARRLAKKVLFIICVSVMFVNYTSRNIN